MFVKMSLRDRLIRFADFAGMTLLALLFLLPLTNCFLRVCFAPLFFLTLFAADFNLMRPLTTFAFSSTAKINKSASTRFAAGTKCLRIKANAVLIRTCASNHLLTSFKLKKNVGGFF